MRSHSVTPLLLLLLLLPWESNKKIKMLAGTLPRVSQGTPESPLDCKKIQRVHPKRNQSWIFIRRTCWSWNSNTLATWCEELTHLKRPWCWERLKAREGDNRGWDGWMASVTQWTWVWVNAGDGQGGLACCSPWGRKEDTTEQLNWTELFQKQPLNLTS